MDVLFLKVLNMSISASWLILAIILLRVLLKKAPRWIHCVLWAFVAVRLLCPVSLESSMSLIPNAEPISQEIFMVEPPENQNSPIFDPIVNPNLPDMPPVTIDTSIDQIQITYLFAAMIWMVGAAAMLAYAAISYIRVKHKVNASLHLQNRIWICDDIQTPFILGCFQPKIYIPSGTDEAQLPHIIAHENAHLKRRDHLWKPLWYFVLAIHWFNPLVWIAYVFLCRDIELACDEKVIRSLNQSESISYSEALLSCSANRRTVMVCPLAFGEVSVKERVNRVLNYRKPAFWIVITAVIACIVAAVCFLTNPVLKNTVVMGANYDIEEILYAVTVGDEISTEPPFQYCVTADYHLYYQQDESEDWNYLGALTPYELTNDELDSYMPVDEMRKNARVRQITDAYILRVENDNFYLVFQTRNGDTYLAYGWEDIGERGQAGSDDTRLRRLYLLNSRFHSGYVNVNFFQRSLVNTVGNHVYSFANFESDKIPGYHITGFKSGNSSNHAEMTDLGFAVFQTTGEGYRLIKCRVYENAVLTENGIYFCDDPAVADVNGEIRNDNTFDVILILNEDVDKVERVYHAEGKEDWVQADTYIDAPYMSLWSWKNSEGYTAVSQYFYDKNGNQIPADSAIPLNSASWENWYDSSTDIPVFSQQQELEEVVSTAILNHFAPSKPDGLIHVESHKTLLTRHSGRSGEDISKITMYLLVLHETFRPDADVTKPLEGVGGSYIPAVLTFSVSEANGYVLEEYWEPRNGGYYTDDINKKFPEEALREVWNDQEHVDALEAENQQKALNALTQQGNFGELVDVLLTTICSSPSTSSNPGDYIQEHPNEYDTLLNYGKSTLKYCFTEFLAGGQTDLHGHIMAALCRDIMHEMGETVLLADSDGLTGQDWFDALYANAKELESQYSKEHLEKYYPASWLLLQMINK